MLTCISAQRHEGSISDTYSPVWVEGQVRELEMHSDDIGVTLR